MMLVHHVVTLALILLSYHFNFVRLVHHAGPSVPRTAPPQTRVACHAAPSAPCLARLAGLPRTAMPPREW